MPISVRQQIQILKNEAAEREKAAAAAEVDADEDRSVVAESDDEAGPGSPSHQSQNNTNHGRGPKVKHFWRDLKKGDQVTMLEDETVFKTSFKRFPRSSANGWTEQKRMKCGGLGVVHGVYHDWTATIKFDGDRDALDFPLESIACKGWREMTVNKRPKKDEDHPPSSSTSSSSSSSSTSSTSSSTQ